MFVPFEITTQATETILLFNTYITYVYIFRLKQPSDTSVLFVLCFKKKTSALVYLSFALNFFPGNILLSPEKKKKLLGQTS